MVIIAYHTCMLEMYKLNECVVRHFIGAPDIVHVSAQCMLRCDMCTHEVMGNFLDALSVLMWSWLCRVHLQMLLSNNRLNGTLPDTWSKFVHVSCTDHF